MRQKKERTLFSFGKHSSLPSLTRSSKPHLPQFPAAVHQSQPVFHNRLSSSPYITSHSQSSSFKLQGHTLWVKMALWRVRSASSIFINNILHRSAIFNTVHRHLSTDVTDDSESLRKSMTNQLLHMDINSLVGSCMPLAAMRIGTIIHNIEMNPGQGGKLVRAAGTSARILKEPSANGCLIRLPSGAEKWIDSKCRATIGTVSNPSHKDKELRKAGQSRWLGRRPVVRGVAMNPVDHPHGGGEGRSKSSGAWGRTSQTPWGKPTKGGYKTGPLKRRK